MAQALIRKCSETYIEASIDILGFFIFYSHVPYQRHLMNRPHSTKTLRRNKEKELREKGLVRKEGEPKGNVDVRVLSLLPATIDTLLF